MRPASPLHRGLFAVAAWLLTCALAHAQGSAQSLPRITLSAGFHNISAEVAQTPDARATGLMHRESMPLNHGMLFIFERPGQQCFWMKNTLIPLDVAFLADDGSIVNIERMKPQTLDAHCSTKPVRYVLEMNDGWFAKRAIAPGFRLKGKPFTP
jgi:uncharacterized membrane protein (UPF0127 family)